MRDIWDTAARYLAYRSHTTAEMRKHLQQKEFNDEEIEAVIAQFIEAGYLNDSLYCQQYFAYAFGKGKGKRVVFAELKEKGIDSETIQYAFEDLDEPYDERAQARAEARKVLRMADIDADDREAVREKITEKLVAKVARRLQSKGYSSDTIYDVIGDLRR